jgi:hypothetical protein
MRFAFKWQLSLTALLIQTRVQHKTKGGVMKSDLRQASTLASSDRGSDVVGGRGGEDVFRYTKRTPPMIVVGLLAPFLLVSIFFLFYGHPPKMIKMVFESVLFVFPALFVLYVFGAVLMRKTIIIVDDQGLCLRRGVKTSRLAWSDMESIRVLKNENPRGWIATYLFFYQSGFAKARGAKIINVINNYIDDPYIFVSRVNDRVLKFGIPVFEKSIEGSCRINKIPD